MGERYFSHGHYEDRSFGKEFASFLPQELPSISILEQYKPHVAWFLNPKQAFGTYHDIGHLTRVLIMQELIANKMQEENPQLQLDREALRWAAATHDVRKNSEYEVNSQAHGIRAAEWVKEHFIQEYPEIPVETIATISHINYYYHARSIDGQPQGRLQELRIFQDADVLDILRIVHVHIPIIGGMPTFVRNAAFTHFFSGMRFDVSRQLFPLAEQLGVLSKKRDSYQKYPFSAVMDTARELKLVRV